MAQVLVLCSAVGLWEKLEPTNKVGRVSDFVEAKGEPSDAFVCGEARVVPDGDLQAVVLVQGSALFEVVHKALLKEGAALLPVRLCLLLCPADVLAVFAEVHLDVGLVDLQAQALLDEDVQGSLGLFLWLWFLEAQVDHDSAVRVLCGMLAVSSKGCQRRDAV